MSLVTLSQGILAATRRTRTSQTLFFRTWSEIILVADHLRDRCWSI